MLVPRAIAVEGVGYKPNVLAVLGFRDFAERVYGMASSIFTGIPPMRRRVIEDIEKKNRILKALLYFIALTEEDDN